MKTGRNAPCPCGSGKKFKKCCLRKNEQEAIEGKHINKEETQSNNSENNIAQEKESNKKLDRIKPIGQYIDTKNDYYQSNEDCDFDQHEQFWKIFNDADFNHKVSIVEKILDDPGEIENYYCFDLIEGLYSSSQNSDDYSIFKRIIHRIKLDYPEIYDNNNQYLLDFLAQLSLAEQNQADAIALITEIADDPDIDVDIIFSAIDHLSYYCDLDIILNIMHIGWENVKNAENVMAFAIDEYAGHSAELEIYKYVQESSNPDPQSDSLLYKLEKFIEPDLENIKSYIAHLTGNKNKVWTQEDFNFKCKMSKPVQKKKGAPQKKPKRIPLDVFAKNVYHLSYEFLGHLVNNEGFLFPKARLAKMAIKDYIIYRVEGKLEYKDSLIERIAVPKQKRKKIISYFDHILCPDKVTTERFISNCLSVWSLKLFNGIIFYEIIPLWLKFIESKGLIDVEIRQKTISSIHELFDTMQKIITNHSKDNAYIIQQIEKAYL